MKDFKVIEVKRSIFEDNNADADRLREQLKSDCFYNEEYKEPVSVFAQGLPSWDVVPPQIMVRRKKKK